MIVTKVEAVTKAKYKVYIDEQFAFVLYKGELSRFRIKETGEITEETVRKIKEEVLLKRAKLRAMHLLNDMARTETQLFQKLKQNGYPQDIAEQAVAYVKSFGYINDEAYIRGFADSRKERKSRREITALLGQKGLNMELVERVLSEVYEEHSDEAAIEEILRRKHWRPGETERKEEQKLYGYLVRKGFRYEDIRRAMAQYQE
ncbi:regulatory protein RecX [Roseburia hominis]